MFSATDFLPACITEFMNFVTTTLPNFGSGRISRLSALWRRDICLSLARVYLWLQLFTFVRPGCCRPPFAFSTQNDPTWVALLRISNAAACGFSRPAYRARHAGCDSARPGDP